MTLGSMRELGVRRLVASCLNDACRHVALIDVSKYPADTEVSWFHSRAWSAPSAAAVGTRSDGPVTAGVLQTFEFNRYKGNLTVTIK